MNGTNKFPQRHREKLDLTSESESRQGSRPPKHCGNVRWKNYACCGRIGSRHGGSSGAMINARRGHRQKCRRLPGGWIAGLSRDAPAIIDVIGIDEMERMRHGQTVEIGSDCILPDHRATPIRADGLADDLSSVVNGVGETEAITRERFQVLHASRSCPEEAMKGS